MVPHQARKRQGQACEGVHEVRMASRASVRIKDQLALLAVARRHPAHHSEAQAAPAPGDPS